jgi:hypothetical protein
VLSLLELNFTRIKFPLNSVYHFLIVFIALGYGYVLTLFPLEAFKDRANYLVYADQSFIIFLRYWSKGLLTWLANEPVWLLLNISINLAFETETTLRIIVGAPASIVAYFVLRVGPKNFYWLLLFLLLPQILKNHIIHLRQGVAVSFFLIGWFSHRRSVRWLFFFLTPFIHASFFFVLFLLLLSIFFKKLRFSAGLRNIFFVINGIIISISLAGVASFFGARQAVESNFEPADVSGLGFVFWFIVLFLFIAQGRNFLRQNSFAIGTLFFYLSTYFFIDVTARIFESALIILLLACLQMTGWRRQMFGLMIVSYCILSYALRLSKPWLGFGFS